MSNVPATRKSPHALLAAALLLLFLAAGTLERSTLFRPLIQQIRARTLDSSALGSGDTTEILQELGLIHPIPHTLIPPRVSGYETEEGNPESPERELVLKQGFYSLDMIRPEDIPDSLMVEPEWLAKPIAIVSLLVEPADLKSLHENPRGRGREWERPAFFAYLEGGRLLFATRVGIRLHGGWTRDKPDLASYRLYFRGAYGARHFKPPIFLGRGDSPPRQLVVRKDVTFPDTDDEVHFRSPMAYEIARQVGGPAPKTQPVLLFLNGRSMGIRALTEYVHLDFLKAYFGHEDFVLVRTKTGRYAQGSMVKEGDPLRYRELRRWARKEDQPLNMRSVSQKIDLDNLSRWFLSVLFCVTDDAFQGALVLDMTDPAARWFWIAWDMDQSFDFPVVRRRSSFEYLLEGSDLRSRILKRLISDDPEYRHYLSRLSAEVMSDRLTQDFIEELIERYRGYAVSYGVEDRNPRAAVAVMNFLRNRRSLVAAEVDDFLAAFPR